MRAAVTILLAALGMLALAFLSYQAPPVASTAPVAQGPAVWTSVPTDRAPAVQSSAPATPDAPIRTSAAVRPAQTVEPALAAATPVISLSASCTPDAQG